MLLHTRHCASFSFTSRMAEESWLVAAASVPALATLAGDRERLLAVSRGMSPAAGRLLPEAWESRRRQAQRNGIVIEPAAWKSLTHWARRLSVDVPDPL